MPAYRRQLTERDDQGCAAQNVLELFDSRLEQTTWFVRDDFTAADIMSVFSMTTMLTFIPFDLSGYPYVEIYREGGVRRKAYRDAMAKEDPGFTSMLGGPALELFSATKLSTKLVELGESAN
jgi:glutathione S-transferase